MSEKKSKQIAAKRKHREQLKSQRRAAPILDRPIGARSEKPTILIVCEGVNTEPSYFNQFRVSSVRIKPIGVGFNTVSLVCRAIELSESGDFDQVWCVFDKDDFSDKNFNEAIQMANANGLEVAYSNQAFEYWLILHFNDHQGGRMNRRDYNSVLNSALQSYSVTYDGDGNKKVSRELFELLSGIEPRTNRKRVELAIDRAKRNYKILDNLDPADRESSTTVFRLVMLLLEHS